MTTQSTPVSSPVPTSAGIQVIMLPVSYLAATVAGLQTVATVTFVGTTPPTSVNLKSQAARLDTSGNNISSANQAIAIRTNTAAVSTFTFFGSQDDANGASSALYSVVIAGTGAATTVNLQVILAIGDTWNAMITIVKSP